MSRYGSTDYNPGSDSTDSSGDDDYKERTSLKLDKYATLEFTLDSVGAYSGDKGTSIIVNMDDAVVRDGIVMERSDGTLKVFGWDQWFDRDDETMELIPFDEDADSIDRSVIPDRHSETFFGDTYRYELIDTVLESEGDDPVSIGDVELWLSNTTKARTIAKVTSTYGHDIVADKDDDYDWLAYNVERQAFPIREELEGRRVMLWIENDSFTPEDSDEEVTYTDAVLLDAETEAGLTIDNSGAPEETDDGGGRTEAKAAADGGPAQAQTRSGFPPGVEELIGVFARSGQDNRERVEHMIENEVDDLNQIDMDAVMAEIEERM